MAEKPAEISKIAAFSEYRKRVMNISRPVREFFRRSLGIHACNGHHRFAPHLDPRIGQIPVTHVTSGDAPRVLEDEVSATSPRRCPFRDVLIVYIAGKKRTVAAT